MANWEVDARQTGEIDRNHKPYIAMRATRCVEPGEGNGGDRRSDQWKEVSTETGKCSARKFAELSGISHPTVMSYIARYRACAEYFSVYIDDMEPMVDGWVPTDAQWKESIRAAAEKEFDGHKAANREQGLPEDTNIPPSFRGGSDSPRSDNVQDASEKRKPPPKLSTKAGTETVRERSNYRREFMAEVGSILELVKKYEHEEAAIALREEQIESAERMGKLLLDWAGHVRQIRKEVDDLPTDVQ